MPEMIINNVGYGMGKRNIGKLNALRVIMGDLLDEATIASEEISIMETAIDDMNPEMLGFTMDKLFDIGALDIYYTPIYMKKIGQQLLTVVALPEKESEMINLILSETSTLVLGAERKDILWREKLGLLVPNMVI